MDELHKVPFLVRHVLDTLVAEKQSTVKSDTKQEIPQTYRNIPALLMRIVMPPNASRAVWMTAAPSATEEELTTALPPASRIYGQSKHRPTCKIGSRTFRDLVYNLLRCLLADIVDDNIRTPGCEE